MAGVYLVSDIKRTFTPRADAHRMKALIYSVQILTNFPSGFSERIPCVESLLIDLDRLRLDSTLDDLIPVLDRIIHMAGSHSENDDVEAARIAELRRDRRRVRPVYPVCFGDLLDDVLRMILTGIGSILTSLTIRTPSGFRKCAYLFASRRSNAIRTSAHPSSTIGSKTSSP